MADSELLLDIRTKLGALSSVSELPRDEAVRLIDDAGKKFVHDVSRVWWWTAISGNVETLEYGDEDGVQHLRQLLSPEQRVRLVVTDDQPGPWPVLDGKLGELCDLLCESRFFEYFVVDESYRWIVFDTHLNTLIFGGEMAEVARRALGRATI